MISNTYFCFILNKIKFVFDIKISFEYNKKILNYKKNLKFK